MTGWRSPVRSYSLVPLERSGERLPSVDVTLAIHGNELRSVAWDDMRIRPGEANEFRYPTRLDFANPNPYFPPGVLHIVGLGVCHVNPSLVVKGNSASGARMGPCGGMVSLLVEDLDPAVAPVSHEDSAVHVDGDGV